MIKVNLSEAAKKKTAKPGMKVAGPSNMTPILLLLIFLGSAGFAYWWYSDLTGQSQALDSQIQSAQAQKASLDAVIKQDQVYETRKKALENRVKIIEGLQRNQVSPVVALDVLSDAVDKTQYVWLSSLDQNNAIFSMNGIGTSLLAIADFYSNLQATGYFKNIDVMNAQDAQGNFTFSLKCEFSPPTAAASSTPAPPAGAN
ncbi:MAG TPA: PilN domain-containing protein [Terriglobia bacterium]|nr:PilN domain-containing protein [Terriglobia bacterium]